MYSISLQINFEAGKLDLQLDLSTESNYYETSTPNEDHPPAHKKATIERCFQPPMENIEKENTTHAAGNVGLNKEDHPPSQKKATIETCFEPPMENIEKENTTLAAGKVKLNKVP